MFCLPRVCLPQNGKMTYRPHPHIVDAFSRKAEGTPSFSRGQYRVVTTIADGEHMDIGGYRLTRAGDRIVADRTSLIREGTAHTRSVTKAVSHPERLEIYTHPHMIEVYVSDGESVLSHAVYGLHDTFICPGPCTVYTTDV